MDQPQSAKSSDGTEPVGIDEMRSPEVKVEPAHWRDLDAPRSGRPAARDLSRPRRLSSVLAFGAVLLAMSALAFAGWIYAEGQREILRLSTELAQLRVSLDLYIRNGSGEAVDLTAMTDRLAALEQRVSGEDVPMPAAPTPATPETTSAADANADCLPEGMRLLVAAGDSYPICEQSAVVSVSFVDNGYITLDDGTSVASGGTMPLPGSACTLAVTSGGDEGLTGYAEIRVTC